MKVPSFLKDLAERVAWTAAQGALSVVSVDALHVPLWAAPIVMAGLAALKGYVGKHVNGTAALPVGKHVKTPAA